ncbi:MAG: 2-oxoacid:acceptor oxidoreductase family protein, partial [Christensenellales bacterium]
MTHQLIIAGFGGQGVLSMGMLLAYAGMLEGRNVTWLPAYGPEMRGGTANCNVIISDREIGSPLVLSASSVIAMNRPSLEKFEGAVEGGGLLFVNSSLIPCGVGRKDVQPVYVPANDIAASLGNVKTANVVMLGAFLGKTGLVELESVVASLPKVWGKGKEQTIAMNREALALGAREVE